MCMHDLLFAFLDLNSRRSSAALARSAAVVRIPDFLRARKRRYLFVIPSVIENGAAGEAAT